MGIHTVKMEGLYQRNQDVPQIGQRRRMRVNGKMQTMTLNQLTATRSRRWDYNEKSERMYPVTDFKTQEQWGPHGD